MNVVIVGAGPSGSTVAYELAKDGHNVRVFEEHPAIGRPIACTGIVTRALFDFVERDDDYIINELEGVRITAPSGKTVDIPLKEFVICRERFDTFLAKRAIKAGAEYHTRFKFRSLDEGSKVARFSHKGKDVEVKYDILIGADGPFSAVARASGLLSRRKYYVGSQATVVGKFDPDWFLTFFGSCAPGFFAWAVPESAERVRAGVASQRHVHKYFDLLREKFSGEIVERQAGPIPIFDGAKNVQKGSIYLVGDAAGVVKNTTGGGIITGMWSAKILADCLRNNKNYSRALRPLRRELLLHWKLRNMLDKFSDYDYELLVDMMSKDSVKRILHKYPREYPSKFLWRLLLAQPRLIRFARFAI